jgi:hypothetical protein
MFSFAPAISEQILNILFTGRFDLNWWCRNSPFQHHAGLLSAYYLYHRIDEHYKDFREIIQFPKTSLFIIDSGGFELYSPKSKNNPYHDALVKVLTPQKVLSIQEAIADIGFILDLPPYLDAAHTTTPEFFQEAMITTAENTRIMIANRNPSSKLKLYGVLQGKQLAQLLKWWETMKVFNGKVDGWALASRGDFERTIMYIFFILLNEINVPVHFLGTGNPDAFALIIYLLRKDENGLPYFPHLITADSTSYNSAAFYGEIFGTDPSVCDCPLTDLHSLCNSFNGKAGLAKSLHDLNYLQKRIQTLTSLIEDDPKRYIEYVLSNSDKKRDEMSVFFEMVDSIVAEKRRKWMHKGEQWLKENAEAVKQPNPATEVAQLESVKAPVVDNSCAVNVTNTLGIVGELSKIENMIRYAGVGPGSKPFFTYVVFNFADDKIWYSSKPNQGAYIISCGYLTKDRYFKNTWGVGRIGLNIAKALDLIKLYKLTKKKYGKTAERITQ